MKKKTNTQKFKIIDTVEFTIDEEPIPKLAGKIVFKGGKPTIAQTTKVKNYEQTLKLDMLDYMNEYNIDQITSPIIFSASFYIPRPKTVKRSKREYPRVRTDLEKYLKSLCDGLNDTIYKDDGQIIGFENCYKFYADDRFTSTDVIIKVIEE